MKFDVTFWSNGGKETCAWCKAILLVHVRQPENTCMRRINGYVLYHANIFIVLCLKEFHVEQSDRHNTKGNWTYYIVDTLVRSVPKKMNY